MMWQHTCTCRCGDGTAAAAQLLAAVPGGPNRERRLQRCARQGSRRPRIASGTRSIHASGAARADQRRWLSRCVAGKTFRPPDTWCRSENLCRLVLQARLRGFCCTCRWWTSSPSTSSAPACGQRGPGCADTRVQGFRATSVLARCWTIAA